MEKEEELLKQMVWVIPKENDNYFYQKKLGRRHKEGIDEYIKQQRLNITADSEYDGMVKLGNLGNCVILNNGKTDEGYIGVCIMPELLSDKQKNFFNLFKETLDKFCIFQIQYIINGRAENLNNTELSDLQYFYNRYFEKNDKIKFS